MLNIKNIIFILLINGLISCISISSENIDPNKSNKTIFNKDLADCQEDYPESGSGLHYRQWKSCMNLKGWK
jgi:hypothetical protein